VRIAFVVHDFNRQFGHSRYVAELAERFVPEHEVHVYANSFRDVAPGLHTHRVPALRATALTTILTFPVPASRMIGDRFDVVHAQGVAVARADVITAHISNRRWMQGRARLEGNDLSMREQLFGAVVGTLEKRALSNPSTTIIAVSQALKDDIAALYGRHDAIVIPHGVDRRQFNAEVRTSLRQEARHAIGLSNDATVFLYAGDLRKGFTPAIRALARVPDAVLLGVSRSDPAPYIRIAVDHGVGGRVRLRPFTDAIEREYAAADAFVFPTPYDAFGMVLTEAMACGLPVVSTPHAGAADLITDGVNGLIVTDANAVDELAAAMRRLVADPALRMRLGLAASDAVRACSWDTVAARTMDVYQRHLSARKDRNAA
jgi:UDP-glucose:(heptosyl)LPS alpha-1,3-glucosyltransferase